MGFVLRLHNRPDATRLHQTQPGPSRLPGPVNSHKTLPNLTRLPDPTKSYQTLPGPTSAQTLPNPTDPARLPDLGASGGRRAASGRKGGRRGGERSQSASSPLIPRPCQISIRVDRFTELHLCFVARVVRRMPSSVVAPMMRTRKSLPTLI